MRMSRRSRSETSQRVMYDPRILVMDRLDRSIGIYMLALNDSRNAAALDCPYDDPKCFHGTVASACICVHLRFHLALR
jgi:hypothetical protein